MRVLVAGEDATTRLVVEKVVRDLGHQCIVAINGKHAWRRLQAEPVDVLITDWVMPDIDGPELCRRIRSRATDDTYTYTIIATALHERANVLEGMRAGADDFLVKPIEAFAVETRLIAAERVTALHAQIRAYRAEFERLNRDLEEQTRTDPLTGLGNRRRLEEDLHALHAGSARHNRPYSIAMCDLDHFKSFNDTYGHPCGDDALQSVGAVLASDTRAGDTAYRFGGEEFILLLADERLAGAVIAVDRFRESIEALGILHASNIPAGVLTVSVGVASYDTDSTCTSAEILEQADQALYVAKRDGRNRVSALPGAELLATT
ncbi:MAG TPA: diguanylate cyclase [Acidimicrobiia bacterium]|nr:diguanylate cyclase [Acidimicrobiia bacterium]